MATPRISRRLFLSTAWSGLLAGGAACALRPLAGITSPPAGQSASQGLAAPVSRLTVGGTLEVPPLLPATMDGATKVFSLTATSGVSEFLSGLSTPTAGFNGSYLGPTVRVAEGDRLRMLVTNELGEATTVHWHGMHLPAAMDGGPHQVIEPDGTWSPEWTVRQPAASLWYHPHLMGATQAQVGRGLAGMLIVDDASPAQQALPHTYGIDDLPLILQDQVIGDDGRLRQGFGARGGTAVTLVNGVLTPTLQTPMPRVRLRLLNASSRRIYSLGLVDDRPFHQVASDGGLLPAPVSRTRLELGPAERAEIVVDLAPGEPTVLQAFPLRGRGVGFGGIGRATGTLLTVETTATNAENAALPSTLNVVERIDPASANVVRDIVLARGGRRFTINGQAMASPDALMDMDSAFQAQLDDTELWRLVNTSGVTHLFHVHGVAYQIVDRAGSPPPPEEAGWKDTVMVHPNEIVRIIMTFRDYPDLDHPFMYHCHILPHEDGGMMGQFTVGPRAGNPAAPAAAHLAGHAGSS